MKEIEDTNLIANAAKELAAGLIAEIEDYLAKHVEGERWLTTAGAAKHLGVPASTVRKLTARRAIPLYQEGEGARCFFRASELDEWRREHKVERVQ